MEWLSCNLQYHIRYFDKQKFAMWFDFNLMPISGNDWATLKSVAEVKSNIKLHESIFLATRYRGTF